MPTRLLVVEQVGHEDSGVFGPMIAGAGFEPVVVRMHEHDPVPEDPAAFDGILVMGGPMNVDQVRPFPWLAHQLKLIAEASRLNIPLLGVCLGSQLVAAALGGRVYAGKDAEIGWYGLNLTKEAADDPLLGDFPGSLQVFQWHGQTFDPPPGATLLAGSPLFPHQAFRAGQCTWGVQFHLEVTAAHVSNWLAINREEVQQEGVDAQAVIDAAVERLKTLEPLARKLFGRFLDICRSRTGRG
jgi:GMP synthase (glutamine-hydrolysing)